MIRGPSFWIYGNTVGNGTALTVVAPGLGRQTQFVAETIIIKADTTTYNVSVGGAPAGSGPMTPGAGISRQFDLNLAIGLGPALQLSHADSGGAFNADWAVRAHLEFMEGPA